MKILIVIPARWGSSRFVGKPLAKINKIPMIKRVYKKAVKSKEASDVIVATDDKKISNFCKNENIKVIMTSKSCNSGTDRVYQVSKKIKSDIYVNLQGDEPLIKPQSIDKKTIHFSINCSPLTINKEWTNASPAIQGIKEIFSTGSQNHHPPQPSS